jgi:threonine/homoserine/homoserine lactone efflux protein
VAGLWIKRAPFLQTLALTIVNPLGIVAFAGLALQLPATSSIPVATWLCLCVFLGSLLVQLALALGGTLIGRLPAHAKWLPALNLLSGLGVALFGVVGLRHWLAA